MLTTTEGTEKDREHFGNVGSAHQISQCFLPPLLFSPDCGLKGSPHGTRGHSCKSQGEFVGSVCLTSRRL